ncbi:hypothetical protein Rsub_06486 [Raphidocelis subcapitata]|uniref:Phosphate transporter n=1 Tax=Raphidocelis subcapitata TaxID=307507 RepID=A0A2V0P2X6_9CHLO|nr:hypothetical protein Rsub_06486 [Raphidocelis subcapitata]|eukprot:GBF94216.1 hypothetical protein Rsub_06486 [Raphidocelis subcapitata]
MRAEKPFFEDQPDILAFGMLCALLATGIWMLTATYWELPVSSTQAITAGVAAMAIVAEGFGSVKWWVPSNDFPYMKMSMGFIAISWIVAPLLAAIFSAVLYWVVRAVVLRSSNAYQRSLFLLPMFTCVTFFVVTFFIIEKGGPQYGWDKTPVAKKAWVSAVAAAGSTLIAGLVGIPLLRRKVERDVAEAAAAAKSSADTAIDLPADKAAAADAAADEEAGAGAADGSLWGALQRSRAWRVATAGVNYDIHKIVDESERVREIHDAAEAFDSKAETSFKYLQVCTACANAFAHGSNEVANAVGPLAAIYQVWQEASVRSSSAVPHWLLAIGAFGICFGLATYGHYMIQAMGVKTARLTNSRGFVVELCVAAVVILASRLGLPMSSTPATVGAIAGVGLWEGRRGFNTRLFLKFCAGWVVTIIATVLLTMAFTAQGLYSPNKFSANERAIVGAYLNLTATQAAGALPASSAQAILSAAAGQKMPILSLLGPMETQAAALSAFDAAVWPRA